MALAPKGDPQRDLARAADETKSLGLCMIGLGALAGTCFLANVMMLGGSIYLLSFIVSCGGFGLFYVYAAAHERRGRMWAPTALAVTGAQAAWVVGFLAWSAWRGQGRMARALLLPSTIWLTALAVVVFYAIRATRAIRLLMLDGPTGFEVPVSALPVDPHKDPPPLDTSSTSDS
ncbi:MAG TPA: hypothetical protein VGR35_01885 [Tepidisphaeraceae bacterium]|nr:hypothetical protein [Tepidisphaeraceae bacterium]